jgi:hypothetical protein
MLRHKTSGELCLFHQRALLQLESAAEIGAELLALGADFQNPIRINFVLGKLFAHVATGRMHRRDASTLAYIAQLLLQTIDEERYELARDQYDYRGWTQAVEAQYGRPKLDRATHARAASSATPHSESLAGAGPQTGQQAPPPTTPTSMPPVPQTPDEIRAQYPPPANPEIPEPLPDTPWLRQLVLDRRAANASNNAQQPHPPVRL